MTSTASTLLEQVTDASALPQAAPEQLRVDAADAAGWLRDHGLPTSRDEAWKYTPIKDVVATQCEVPTGLPLVQYSSKDIDRLAGDHGGPRLVFVDGFFCADLSTLGTRPTPDGVVFGGLAVLDELDGRLTAGLTTPLGDSRLDGFQMLNRVFGSDGAVVLVDPGTAVSVPLHVVHLASTGSRPLVSHPRVIVGLGAGSSATLIESFVGDSGSGLVNATASILLEDQADLRHYKVQSDAISRTHLSHVAVRQQESSNYRTVTIMLGGGIARQAVDVIAAGNHTSTDLSGLYLPSGTQRHDNVLTVEHRGSGGRSNQTYKGVIDDRARGSFSGHIIVDAGTTATDAHQNNRSVLLNPVAQSDSRPWLEIFADDVSCTHGSAVGRLDEDSLFYLQTRGIPLDEARAMLIGGFINEILDAIDVESLREHTTAAVSHKVSARVSADLGSGE